MCKEVGGKVIMSYDASPAIRKPDALIRARRSGQPVTIGPIQIPKVTMEVNP
jgi:hypothetical protein